MKLSIMTLTDLCAVFDVLTSSMYVCLTWNKWYTMFNKPHCGLQCVLSWLTFTIVFDHFHTKTLRFLLCLKRFCQIRSITERWNSPISLFSEKKIKCQCIFSQTMVLVRSFHDTRGWSHTHWPIFLIIKPINCIYKTHQIWFKSLHYGCFVGEGNTWSTAFIFQRLPSPSCVHTNTSIFIYSVLIFNETHFFRWFMVWMRVWCLSQCLYLWIYAVKTHNKHTQSSA